MKEIIGHTANGHMGETKEVKPSIQPDPLFSFIVPVYKVPLDVLKRCLMSIDDQDYPNYEVIVVLDGPDSDAEEVIKPFKNKKGWNVIVQEHGGACKARNTGFEASRGEIVSFFNSDYVANPGMVQLWVDTLMDHKDFGFVYGPYQYASSQSHWYPSKKFDAWELEVANYIDCGFPLWRKYVVKWDENCKSLQDWDFWLRVVKEHGVKGYFLDRDVSYVAELPRAKGLSDDSSNNWKDRVNYIKAKNGIPNRDVVVTSLGAGTHGREIAKMIGADFRDDTISKPNDYKALYMIGFFMRPDQAGNQHPEILSYFKKQKRIIHFVGADIYWLRKFPWDSLKYLSGALKLSSDAILCETEEAQKELAEFGIKADIVPIPAYSQLEVKPLPKTFRVAMFLTNKSDFDKYLYEHTTSIIRCMPDIEFTAYGDAGKDIVLPNFKHYGNLDRKQWEDYINKNSCILRIVRHDTLPLATSEFLMAGRSAISNLILPYASWIDASGKKELNQWDKYASGFNDLNWPETKKKIVTEIRRVKDNPRSEKEIKEASEFYRGVMDKGRYFESLSKYMGVQINGK